MSPLPPDLQSGHTETPSRWCRGLTDESEIPWFLGTDSWGGAAACAPPHPHPQVPGHPGTAMWFRTYMWGRHLPGGLLGFWGLLSPLRLALASGVGCCTVPTRGGLPGWGRHPLPGAVGTPGWRRRQPGSFSRGRFWPWVTVDSLCRNVDPPVQYDTYGSCLRSSGCEDVVPARGRAKGQGPGGPQC